MLERLAQAALARAVDVRSGHDVVPNPPRTLYSGGALSQHGLFEQPRECGMQQPRPCSEKEQGGRVNVPTWQEVHYRAAHLLTGERFVERGRGDS